MRRRMGEPRRVGVEYREGSDVWISRERDGSYTVSTWGAWYTFSTSDNLCDGLLALDAGEIPDTANVLAIAD